MSKGGPRRWAPGPASHDEDQPIPAPHQHHARPTVPAAGGIFKSAAVEVLRRTRRLMPTGEICRLALDWRLLTCSGKTPEATMASAMYGDIKRKDRHSLFIRPQEGMFGLREWVDQGLLPSWQEPSATLAAAAAAMMAPITVTPAKRVNTSSSSACQQAPALGAGGVNSKGAGRAKKARRGHGCSDGGEADRSDSDCSDDDRRCPSADRNTLYSLRNGPAVRLEEAATAPTAGPTAIAAPGAWCWQQQQREEGMPHACLEPLDLPNLRPCSAEGTRLNTVSGICRRSTSGSGVSLLSPPLYTVLQSPLVQAAPGTGPGGSCVASILSPGNVLAELRSPLMKLPFLASLGDTPGSLAGLLSPRAGPVASTSSQHYRSSSANLQREAWSALKGAAAAAAGAAASAVIARNAAPGLSPDMSVSTMVPVSSSTVSGISAHAQQMPRGLDLLPILPLNLCQQQQPHGLAGVAAGAAPSHGRSDLLALPPPHSGGQPGPAAAGSGGAGVPEVVFRLLPQQDGARRGAQEAVPIAVHGGGRVQPPSGEALPIIMQAENSRPGIATAAAAVRRHAWVEGVHGGPAAAGTEPSSGGSAAAIAQKICEVEGKVAAVEQKWGQLSLKTGKAYFLLYHACCHPQAALLFLGKARQALQRARDILQHVTQLGLPDRQGEECRSLLESIEAAAAGSQWA